MLQALTAIFACQLAGEATTVATGLPLPGPVVGMALLFLYLVLRGRVPDELSRVGDTLLANLSLLFVPAGAGIMMHVSRLEGEVVPVTLAIVVSTLATIAVTALIMARFGPARASRDLESRARSTGREGGDAS